MDNSQQIKEYLSKIIGKSTNGSFANIMRYVLFDNKNVINWNKVCRIMIEQMPELKLDNDFMKLLEG